MFFTLKLSPRLEETTIKGCPWSMTEKLRAKSLSESEGGKVLDRPGKLRRDVCVVPPQPLHKLVKGGGRFRDIKELSTKAREKPLRGSGVGFLFVCHWENGLASGWT